MTFNKTKKTVIAALSVLCIGAVGLGTSMAYLTEHQEVTNVFTVGDLKVGLTETNWDPSPESPDGKDMYPGYTVYKNPTVKNLTDDKNGEEPCYARVVLYINDKDGNAITDSDTIDLVMKTIYWDPTFTGTYDTEGTATGLVEGKVPGYSLADLAAYKTVNPVFTEDTSRSRTSEEPNKIVFNYMGTDNDGVLDIDEEATLFSNIVIPTDWNQTQLSKISDFQIEVVTEAIQTKGFATQADAFTALDKEVADGTIQQSGSTDTTNATETPASGN